MTLDINLNITFNRPDEEELQTTLDEILAMLDLVEEKGEQIMQLIDDLKAEVARNTTVEKSALALIQGFAKQLSDAIAAAVAAGVSPADLQTLTDLKTNLAANDDELVNAVLAGTPSAPAPAPVSVV